MTGTGFYKHKLQAGYLEKDRDSLLLRLCKGKRVIHVGCTDSPHTSELLREGRGLHKKLLEVTQFLVGVDIDRPGLEMMEKEYGGEYVCHDLCSADPPPTRLLACSPDVILAADVIEHVTAPGPFLRSLALVARRAANNTSLVVSTPNGLGVRQLMYTAFGFEVIHPDHRLVCTPNTLAVLADDVDLTSVAWYFYNLKTGEGAISQVSDCILDAFTRLRAAYADGMTAVFRLKSDMESA
jgi:2-polyprenyl-3-methyl-5-hydroxy-6-metoxy-1,4-benzoquinol methylase